MRKIFLIIASVALSSHSAWGMGWFSSDPETVARRQVERDAQWIQEDIGLRARLAINSQNRHVVTEGRTEFTVIDPAEASSAINRILDMKPRLQTIINEYQELTGPQPTRQWVRTAQNLRDNCDDLVKLLVQASDRDSLQRQIAAFRTDKNTPF